MIGLSEKFRAVSYGSGPRNWYIQRIDGVKPITIEDTRGNYRRFGSYESAKLACLKMEKETT